MTANRGRHRQQDAVIFTFISTQKDEEDRDSAQTILRVVAVSWKQPSIPVQTKLLDSDSKIHGLVLVAKSSPPTGVAILCDDFTSMNYYKTTHEQRSIPFRESSSESISENVGPGVSTIPFPSIFLQRHPQDCSGFGLHAFISSVARFNRTTRLNCARHGFDPVIAWS